jgi:CBS domain-containing membrane protein
MQYASNKNMGLRRNALITVDELMTRELYTLRETDSVHHAHDLMTQHKIRHIPILDKDGLFAGLLTQRDVLAAAVSLFSDISTEEREDIERHIPVSELMTTNIVVAEKGTDLREVARHLLVSKHGCLPIVAKGYLQGIITESDFVRLALNLMERLALYEASRHSSS